VIHEIDTALDQLIRNDALEGSGADVVFDAPTKEWAGRRNAPTVNLYLYDIREDMNRRHSGVFSQRDESGVVTARVEPIRYFRLTYLATAWTQRPQDEHLLLSAMLSAFLRHKILPAEFLSGSVAAAEAPVLIEVARPHESRQISEVWTALGGELKPSLEVVVTAPMSTAPVPVTAPPASGGAVVRMFGEPGQEDEASKRPEPAALPEGAAAEDDGQTAR
jgi:hypothetical protein